MERRKVWSAHSGSCSLLSGSSEKSPLSCRHRCCCSLFLLNLCFMARLRLQLNNLEGLCNHLMMLLMDLGSGRATAMEVLCKMHPAPHALVSACLIHQEQLRDVEITSTHILHSARRIWVVQNKVLVIPVVGGVLLC